MRWEGIALHTLLHAAQFKAIDALTCVGGNDRAKVSLPREWLMPCRGCGILNMTQEPTNLVVQHAPQGPRMAALPAPRTEWREVDAGGRVSILN